MTMIVDRFEGDYAVVEIDGKVMTDIPRRLLPPEVKEGQVIKRVNGRYEIDFAETKKREVAMQNLSEGLWE